jgi:BlaI family transcriptional regulator, penicillinase repressor
MTRASRPQTLTPQELSIMKVIWRLGSATVREVYEALRAKRSIAYTTVMTMMNVLEEKGYLKKQRADRAFRYRPTRSRQQVVTAMVREFVNRVFDGAAQPLMLHLVRTERLSHDERAELRRMMDETIDAADDE